MPAEPYRLHGVNNRTARRRNRYCTHKARLETHRGLQPKIAHSLRFVRTGKDVEGGIPDSSATGALFPSGGLAFAGSSVLAYCAASLQGGLSSDERGGRT